MATKTKSRRPARGKAVSPPSSPGEVRPAERQVTIAPAKGRPMLTWVGKHVLRHVPAFPAQHIETFDPLSDAAKRSGDLWADWPKKYPRGGLLFHGDNKEVLAHLLANGFRGKVKLIYIDPPFDSGADYVRRVTLRGPSGTAKIDGEGYALGEQIQYTDIWANDNYLQFMYERLLLLKELLAEGGSVYVHLNNVRLHYVKLLCDEIFTEQTFETQIVWKRVTAKGTNLKTYGEEFDTILYYANNQDLKSWNTPHKDYSAEQLRAYFKYVELPDGSWRQLTESELNNPETIRGKRFSLIPTLNMNENRPNLRYEFMGFLRTWKWEKGKMEKMRDQGLIIQTGPKALPQKKQYLDEREGMAVNNLWTDIPNTSSSTRTGYPTEKNEELLNRIISASSKPGDIVLDCFVGSGTTAAVAQKLGRRWIGCDINKGAIQTTSKRLQTIMQEQVAEAKKRGPQLVSTEQDKPQPAQLSFAVYRVNDYDLAIQHNEAANLVCEHIGIERTRADRYFDGTLGKRLVKITPFGHPLTPLDLEELKRELQARPEEERDVVVVCLGKELAVNQWLE
ncbi:MAG: site-specific DNA-methyltransferase [Candidatus Omnitrophica bacterium]|nr:site-specific DNA-methyltransferase [Candidatus Omnitrophota bacterium]